MLLHLVQGTWRQVDEGGIEECPVGFFEIELLADEVDICVLQWGACKVKTNNLMVRSCCCLIINCPAGDELCYCEGCKAEVKDGGACSISVVVGGGVFFVKELEVVGVSPGDVCLCSFWCLDCRVPALVIGIEVSSNDGMLG